MTPFFTRDFLPLITMLDIKTYQEGQVLYDFGSVPTHFYVIKQGRIKFEDYRLYSQGKSNGKKQGGPLAKESHLTKVEGEWFGFESFVCGAYATMTQEQLLQASLDREHGSQAVGNGFRATAIERCEVVVGSLETMFSYLSMEDITHLHCTFMQSLYQGHPAYNSMAPRQIGHSSISSTE